MGELWSRGVGELADGIRRRDWSCAEVIASVATRISQVEPALSAWAHLDLDRAAARAAAQDREPAPGAGLAGIPVGVKDVIATRDLPTGMGSVIYQGVVPAADAAAVTALRAAGAVIPGKTVSTSFAGPDPAVTANPWNADRTPGGSSAGSAAAVAAGMVPAALGTQTAGSVLRPAAYCGVVGFKPTFGAIPTHGVFPFAPSLDTVGVMARSVGDVAVVFRAVRRPGEAPDRWAENDGVGAGCDPPVRVGIVDCGRLVSTSTQRRCALVARRLEEHGVEVVDTRLPVDLDVLASAQGVIVRVEAASVHAEAIRDRPDDLEPGLRALVEAGSLIDASTYEDACRRQRELAAAVDDSLAPRDLLVLPTVDGPVPDRTTTGNPELQAIFTFLGMPALTIPTGFGPDGLPLAVQLVARRNEDDHLLYAGSWLERRLGFPLRFPGYDR